MPTYSYLCSECGHRFDTVQRMSEDPLKDCPACNKATLVRQVSAVGFALKGSGWYVTDFRDKGKAAAKTAEADTPAKSDAPATETKAPETKPAEAPGPAAASGD